MAYFEQLPSGKWRAQVLHPSGRKINIPADRLKSVVKQRALEVEASIRRGDYVDQRLGKITIADWYEQCRGDRVIAIATQKRHESAWNVHVGPKWGTWPLSAVTYEECTRWIGELSRKTQQRRPDVPLGPAMISVAAELLRFLLDEAVRANRLAVNPMRMVRLPAIPKHEDRILAQEDEDALLDACDALYLESGKEVWPEFKTFLQVLIGTGLRFQEAAGLLRGNVNPLRRTITVAQVLPRHTRELRRDAKSEAGTGRVVPITTELAKELRVHLGRHDADLVFVSQRGRAPLAYVDVRRRQWLRVVERAGLADPQPTMHDLRHTYGTRLADANVPPHEIMALMGHANLVATQRYLHASEIRFERAREAMESRASRSDSPRAPHDGPDGSRVAGE